VVLLFRTIFLRVSQFDILFVNNLPSPPLNGWNLLSIEDDEEYLSDAANFKILGAKSIYKIAPVMLEIFEAPYGTDLCWLYEEGVHVGFYDLIEERETTIEEILSSAN